MADALAELLLRDGVGQVLVAYARALDTKDWPGLAACFTEDAVTDYGDLAGRHEGSDAIVARCRLVLDGLDATQHLIANIAVDLGSDGLTARSRCSFQAQHVMDGTRLLLVGGTYEDDLVAIDGQWRIRFRTMSVIWTSGDPDVLLDARKRSQASAAG